jgi:hypothetical protein
VTATTFQPLAWKNATIGDVLNFAVSLRKTEGLTRSEYKGGIDDMTCALDLIGVEWETFEELLEAYPNGVEA